MISILIGLAIALVSVIVTHELGHILMALILGYKVTKVKLTAVKVDPTPINTTHILLISIAGILGGVSALVFLNLHWIFWWAYFVAGCGFDYIYMYKAIRYGLRCYRWV